jgi:hypothetical protein
MVFTQGSVLKSLIERWNEERRAGKLETKSEEESKEFEDMFRNDENRAVFLL